MSKRLSYVFVGLAGILILSLVWALVAIASNTNSADSSNESGESTTITRTLTGNTVEEDRAEVYKAAVELLEATNAPAGQEEYVALLGELDSAVAADIPADLLSRIRFADVLNEDALKITTYQALITFASLAKASSPDGVIASLFADGPKTIMVDQETGTANLPLNIFVSSAGEVNTFSLSFVYIDEQWKLAPYSMLDQLRLSLALQQQYAGAAG